MKIFNKPSELFTNIKNKIFKDIIMKKGVQVFLKSALTLGGKITSAAWVGAVEEFLVAKIGMQQLLTKGLTFLAEALGVGTGPIGWAVMIVIQLFGPAIVNKIIKPILSGILNAISFTIKYIFVIFIGVMLGIYFLLGYSNMFSFSPTALISPLVSTGFSVSPEFIAEASDDDDEEVPPITIEGACPFTLSSIDCTQGAHPTQSDCSHYGKSPPPIDLSVGASTTYFVAPSDGIVTTSEQYDKWACGGIAGGVLIYEGEVTDESTGDTMKIKYALHHANPLVGVGPVKKGDVLSDVWMGGQNKSDCWSGEHYHMYISIDGKAVDPEDYLRIACPGVLDSCGMWDGSCSN
jgi:hypothetical protein